MALAALRLRCLQSVVQCAKYTTLHKRPMAYKSSISLETLYPNSSLKLSTPAFNADPNNKFNGYIPINKLDISYSASSGPGGQNVNKVHTKVDLRFKVKEADWLHAEVREKMLEMHNSKLTKEGYLVIRSDITRSQQLNLADCLRKLRGMLRNAAAVERPPSPETVEKIRQRQLKASRLRVATKREDAYKRALKEHPSVLDL